MLKTRGVHAVRRVRPPLPPQVRAAIRAWRSPGSPGGAILMRRARTDLLRGAWGCADIEGRRPITPETTFDLASLSKAFTAYAIHLLERDGVIAASTRVRSILPELPRSAREVTVGHLLSHRSGLPEYLGADPTEAASLRCTDDILTFLRAHPQLRAIPGGDFAYCNTNYALLALVVARTTCAPFATFLRERVLSPLHLTRASAVGERVRGTPARSYRRSRSTGGVIEAHELLEGASIEGDGGIAASLDDVGWWCEQLATSGYFLDPVLQAAAAQERAGAATQYSYGWFVSRLWRTPLLWHTGTWKGFRHALALLPERQVTVVVLTNSWGPSPMRTLVRPLIRWARMRAE